MFQIIFKYKCNQNKKYIAMCLFSQTNLLFYLNFWSLVKREAHKSRDHIIIKGTQAAQKISITFAITNNIFLRQIYCFIWITWSLVKERSKKIKWTNHYEGQASSTRKKSLSHYLSSELRVGDAPLVKRSGRREAFQVEPPVATQMWRARSEPLTWGRTSLPIAAKWSVRSLFKSNLRSNDL